MTKEHQQDSVKMGNNAGKQLDWNEVEEVLSEFKILAERVKEAELEEAPSRLGWMLDYIDKTPLLKDYIESCPLEISQEEINQKIHDCADAFFDPAPLTAGGTIEMEVAFIYRVFAILRNEPDYIERLGNQVRNSSQGEKAIVAFFRKWVIPFYENIAIYFRRLRRESSKRNTCHSVDTGEHARLLSIIESQQRVIESLTNASER